MRRRGMRRLARRRFAALSLVLGPMRIVSVGWWGGGVQLPGEARSALLAVQGAPLEEGVELHFLEAPGTPETLLVPGRHVNRRLLALGFRLRAFKNDDVAWHVRLG